MTFNSLHFLCFFPVVMLLHHAMAHRYRWMLLLAASYYFYMWWNPYYASLLAGTTVIDYTMAILIARTSARARRTAFLAVSLTCNLGLLAVFKYFNFFSETFAKVAEWMGKGHAFPVVELLLPVGISFYTFQSIAYVVDVYRGQAQPQRHFGMFATYVSFFPQLVAGPIERPGHLMPQLEAERPFDYEETAVGMTTMLWGLFKKMVVADQMAMIVAGPFARPEAYGGLGHLLASYAFAVQIYCDFSGYTDVAIGAARCMGVRLMQNFRQPYLATSVPDFWRRWHISLSTWFRDYLYFPLGGSRAGPLRWAGAIFIVFLLSGLWHGAAMKFLVWGVAHGVLMIVYVALGPFLRRCAAAVRLDRLPKLVVCMQMLVTLHLVCATWVIFRANSMRGAVMIFERIVGLTPSGLSEWAVPGLGAADIIRIGLAVCLIGATHLLAARGWSAGSLRVRPWAIRWAAYLVLALAIINCSAIEDTPFIYFQF